jgi:signal transduction histidine kinase
VVELEGTNGHPAAAARPPVAPQAAAAASDALAIARELRRPLCTLAIFVKAAECWLDGEGGNPGEVSAAVSGALDAVDDTRDRLTRLRELIAVAQSIGDSFDIDQIATEAVCEALRSTERARPRLSLRLEAAAFRGRGDAAAVLWSLRELLRAAIASTPVEGEVFLRTEPNETGASLVVETRTEQPSDSPPWSADSKGDAADALARCRAVLDGMGATVTTDVALDGSRTQLSIEFGAAD